MNRVVFGDCRQTMRQLAADGVRVQTVVTSPPYWNLRDYGTAKWLGGDPACEHRARELRRGQGLAKVATRGGGKKAATAGWMQARDACGKCGAVREDDQIGLEPVHDCLGWATGVPCGSCYICHMVDVLRAVRDVLADDGTVWLNIGDSYASDAGNADIRHRDRRRRIGISSQPGNAHRAVRPGGNGLKPKDLALIPQRLALALQADGWWVRSDVIWNKPNPMPESTDDRPTKAHEYVWLLAKSERYFCDMKAIAEPVAESSIARVLQQSFDQQEGGEKDYGKTGINENRSARKTVENFAGTIRKYSFAREHEKGTAPGQKPQFRPGRSDGAYVGPTRNRRTVWTIATKAYRGAHYAVFPPKLVEPCVLAGTSQKGHCPNCLARWVRVVDKTFVPQGDVSLEKGERGAGGQKPMDASNTWEGYPRGTTSVETKGWRPGCDCGERPVPDVVLDPFMGSGTVAEVAEQLGRRWVGCELNEKNRALQQERTHQAGLELL